MPSAASPRKAGSWDSMRFHASSAAAGRPAASRGRREAGSRARSRDAPRARGRCRRRGGDEVGLHAARLRELAVVVGDLLVGRRPVELGDAPAPDRLRPVLLLDRRSRSGARGTASRTRCRRAREELLGAVEHPGAHEVLGELEARHRAPLLGKVGRGRPGSGASGSRVRSRPGGGRGCRARSAGRRSAGSSLTTSMNDSIALSGCSFSRKLRPRKYDERHRRDSVSRRLMSMRAAIQPSAEEHRRGGRSHQKSKSMAPAQPLRRRRRGPNRCGQARHASRCRRAVARRGRRRLRRRGPVGAGGGALRARPRAACASAAA